MSGTRARSVPPPLLLGAAALSLQTGSAVATRLFPTIGVLGVLGLRMSVAALAVFVASRAWRYRPTGPARWAIGAFALALSVMNLLFYLSLERIPLGVTVALELIGPLAVAVVGSRRRGDLAWAALAVAGVGVLVVPGALADAAAAGSGLDPAGIALALGAGSCWAGYIVLGSRMSALVPGSIGLAWAMVAGAVVLLPLGVISAGRALATPSDLLGGVAVGVMSGALPYAVELATMRRVGPRAFGVMMSLEPAAALLTGLVVAGQRLAALSLVGIALVVVASLGSGWRPAPEPGPLGVPPLEDAAAPTAGRV